MPQNPELAQVIYMLWIDFNLILKCLQQGTIWGVQDLNSFESIKSFRVTSFMFFK